jgi:hypothetical protein
VRTRQGEDGAARRWTSVNKGIIAAAAGATLVAGAAAGMIVHTVSGPSKISLSASRSQASQSRAGQAASASAGAVPATTTQHAAAFGSVTRPHWTFSTLDNQNDPTFNQLLGINNRGQISGYFGSGAQNHPNKGYLLELTRRGLRYLNENVPGAVQTQVTGLNDTGVTVGFWSGQNTASQANDNFGFYTWRGRSHTVDYPAGKMAKPPVNQLLGVNDGDIAVGFYTDAKGNNHGYIYSIARHRFRMIKITGATSVTATAISNNGTLAGFFTNRAGVTKSFVRHWFGHKQVLAYPGATATQAFGVNDFGEVVGTYMTGSGDNAKSFGFTWTRRGGFMSVSDPKGMGTTTINGVNDAGDLVGFYTDAAGNTDGLLLAPRRRTAPPAPAPSMPVTPTASPTVIPTMTPTPTMSAIPTKSATPTMSPTGAPTPTPQPPAPTSSASPPGGPW